MKLIIFILTLCLLGSTEADDSTACEGLDDVFVSSVQNCQSYCYCSNGKCILGECEDGLWFEPVQQVCTYAGDYCTQPICYGVPDRSFVADPESCNGYYECINNKPYKGYCPDGLYFEPNKQVCTYPSDVNCTITSSTTSTSTTSTTTTSTTTTATTPDDSTADITTATEPNTTPSVNNCPPEGVHYLPHETSCSKYIICFGGIPFEYECGNTFEFNANLGQCTWPELSECTIDGSMCPTDNTEPVFLPNAADCNSYFICYKGEALQQFCYTDFHWDAINEQCDVPENAKCTDTALPPLAEPEITTMTCPNSADLQFYAHPTDCQFYFLCFNGVSDLRSCGRTLGFRSDTHQCDTPANSGCAAAKAQLADLRHNSMFKHYRTPETVL